VTSAITTIGVALGLVVGYAFGDAVVGLTNSLSFWLLMYWNYKPRLTTVYPGMNLAHFAYRFEVRFVRRDRWWVTRWADRVLVFIPSSSTRFWTAVGTTVAYPTDGPPEFTWSYLLDRRPTVEHEYIHILQRERWGVLFTLSYLLIPYMRWYWERPAYLHMIKHYDYPVDRAVSLLWGSYLVLWPKARMRRWFEEHV
jgi:hypothetical protein